MDIFHYFLTETTRLIGLLENVPKDESLMEMIFSCSTIQHYSLLVRVLVTVLTILTASHGKSSCTTYA